jgi:hypothetical protein
LICRSRISRPLGLDVQRVRDEVDFLQTYAEFTRAELTTELPGPESLDVEEARWIATIDAASALREAAHWALCFDAHRARRLLDSAGELFLEVGQPFGAYLRVIAGGAWYADPSLDQFGRQLEALYSLSRPSEQAEIPAPRALLHPQQQAYLLLAASGTPQIAQGYRALLRDVASTSPHRAGVVPVGALGTPIRRFWEMASLLLGVTPDSSLGRTDDPARAFADELVVLATRYVESIELAQTNTHTWRNAASPVDVGDIDIIGIAVIAARRYGAPLELHLGPRLDGLPYPAQAILEIALEYVRAEPDLGPSFDG